MSKSRKEEYAQATRAALLDAAQILFAEQGYHHTSVDEICKQARVTKGALYHHYRNKEELFTDLVEALEASFVDRMASSLDAGQDQWTALIGGIDMFLDHCLDPAYRRIVLIDAPNVIGATRLAEIGAKTATGVVQSLFESMMAEGVISKQPINVLVRLFLSLLIEGGMLIGESKKPKKTKQDVRSNIQKYLTSLKA